MLQKWKHVSNLTKHAFRGKFCKITSCLNFLYMCKQKILSSQLRKMGKSSILAKLSTILSKLRKQFVERAKIHVHVKFEND